MKFAYDEDTIEIDDPSKQSLLVEIVIRKKQQCFYLNSEQLSAFPEEQEVLLQDGLLYRVNKVEQKHEVVNHNNK